MSVRRGLNLWYIARASSNREAYLCRSGSQRLPLDPRHDVLQKDRIELDVGLLKLCILEMQRKCSRRCLARLHGTGDEICGEDLHYGGYLRFGRV
jgi:hypothetical protein